jgi:hypothetical protein
MVGQLLLPNKHDKAFNGNGGLSVDDQKPVRVKIGYCELLKSSLRRLACASILSTMQQWCLAKAVSRIRGAVTTTRCTAEARQQIEAF